MEINPYSSPKSELAIERSTVKNVAWWIYFSLLLLMFFATLFAFIISGTISLIFLLSTLLDLFCIFGLFGFIRTKKMLSKTFWAVIFFLEVTKLSIATSVFLYNYITYVYETNERFVALVGSLSFILALPLCYALWHYAFKTPQIWVHDRV